MNANLFEVLVDRNIINEQTEIEARVRKNDLSGCSYMKFEGSYYYVAHSMNDDETDGSIIATDTRDGSLATITMSDIISVDGMEPLRLASIYALNEIGESVKQGARRGRKPKNRVAA